MSNLISPQELYEHLGDSQYVIVDTRFSLADPLKGRRDYEAGHIPGALFFDLEKDLSAEPGVHGGRHPLPDMDVFVQKLEHSGIGNDSMVVIYDDAAGMVAGRLWWMLKYLGHDKVKLLDGGYPLWLELAYPSSTASPQPKATSFAVQLRSELLIDAADLRLKLEDPSTVLIDARGSLRYRGEEEPIDPKAGHIPGALNLPYADNLEGLSFKNPELLKARFAELELHEADEIVVYCGSGVSAVHDIIALEEAGIPGAKLYVGSWSDWISYEENPLASGEEP